MSDLGIHTIVIQNVSPSVHEGEFSARGIISEPIAVEADIFTDAHTLIEADLLYKGPEETEWQRTPFTSINNDRYRAAFTPLSIGIHSFTVEAWVNAAGLWQADFKKKQEAGLDMTTDLIIGSQLLLSLKDKELQKYAKELQQKNQSAAVRTALDPAIAIIGRKTRSAFTSFEKKLPVFVTRKRAGFSSWYELFPRSCSGSLKHGTFKDVVALLPDIKKMGFNVLYFPPIHPIGSQKRKGKNNALTAMPDDPGSPWAVGSVDGGHDAIHPELGTLKDFEALVKKALEHGLEIALDIALQCSPDHPYLKTHPEWFVKRPDGTYQYAENPPKKYEDIIPFHFTEKNQKSLFNEITRVFLFWLKKGVRIFRIDNPHTKPFSLWQTVIDEVRKVDPEAIFLAEAFTRPKVMQYLAKIGFDQSYTYFTWRNTKHEITEYVTELTKTEMRDYFRPNFFINTPDILSDHLQMGGKAAFLARFILGATLSSNYGIYGPAFEQLVNDGFSGKEDYKDSEKYEIKVWDRQKTGTIVDTIALINRTRNEEPAFQKTANIEFFHIDNDQLIAYTKHDGNESLFIIVVNLDPYHTQTGFLTIPLEKLGIDETMPYLVDDLLTLERYIWQGRRQFIKLNPHLSPAHLFKVRPKMRKENNFDYYM